MINTAVILAAGNGRRMKTKQSKLLLKTSGKTVLERSISAFLNCGFIDNIIVVCRDCDKSAFSKLLPNETIFVTGGATRQKSVENAIKAVPQDTDIIFIHDGARPLVSARVIKSAYEAAEKYGAAAAAVPVKDTVKVADNDGLVVSTPDRSSLFAVQTPQVFDFSLYKDAMSYAVKNGMDFTDDSALIEYYGKKVILSSGDYSNIKITTPDDILLADRILEQKSNQKGDNMRIGHGYDVHRLVSGRKLIIGGVEIQHKYGLLGHSDADVLLHAVSDALLGACALGDIGTLFPDTADEWEGADSLVLLKNVVDFIGKKGFVVENIDSTVIAQQPKLKPFVLQMRINIAEACGVDVSCVSVKATTEENLGFSGREEGIAAHAVALVNKS